MSSDERGLEPNATVIASLLAHTKGPVWVRLFTRDTPPLTLDSGRLRLEVVTTPEDLRLEGRVPAHVNAGGTFDRIVAIPYCTDWDRAVVLDYDQLVVGDPTDLFEMDLGHALAAGRMWGRSLGSACREWFGRELPEEWRHCQNYRYFYMGPVMNLRALREAGAYDRFVEFHAVANMEEQIAFHVACSDKVVSYDATLNSVPQWDGVGDNTKILHFTGPTKPWNDRQMLGAPLWRKYETTWEELTCGLWNPQENTRETAGVFERVGHVLESLRRDGRTMRVMEIGGWDFGRAQAILRGMLACGPSRWIKIFRPHVDPLALEQAITRFAGPLEDLAEHVEIADGDPVEVLASGLASGELWEALDAIVLHAPRDPAQLSAEVALAWRALRAGGTLAIVPIQRSPGRVAWERYLRARDLLVDSLLDEVAAVSDRHETVLLKGGQAHPIPECGRSAVGTSRIGNGSGWAVVVVTYGDLGTPHLDLLRAVNPCAQVLTAVDTRQGEKWELWRNCDRFLRTWWRENHSRILHNRILFIEHDVKINGCLPDWRGRGIAGKDIKTPHDHPDWHWWIEIAGLAGQGVRGAGVAPLGVLFVTREAMNRIAAPEWDHLFGKDLFCELRLPSAVASCDLPVEQVALPWVSDAASQIDRNLPGIHHPVKS